MMVCAKLEGLRYDHTQLTNVTISEITGEVFGQVGI